MPRRKYLLGLDEHENWGCALLLYHGQDGKMTVLAEKYWNILTGEVSIWGSKPHRRKLEDLILLSFPNDEEEEDAQPS